jgi:Mg2+/Co2+ transporter CorC
VRWPPSIPRPHQLLTAAALVAGALVATVLANWLLGLAAVEVVVAAATIAGFVLAWRLRSDDIVAAELADELGGEDDEWTERELLASVVDFPDTIAREVMVPRPDMVTVDADFRVADVIEVMLLNGYSRLPVCGEGIDDVLGLAYAKDLMGASRDGREDHHVTEVMRPAMFAPEMTRLPELLRQMQEEQFHMAVVLDEYGGTAGLVTLEDILEELVGEIHDEFDVEVPLVEAQPGGDLLVRGRTPIDDLNEMVGPHLPTGVWDTVAGLVTSRLGHVPVEGESVEVAGWRLTAQRIQGRRVGRVHMSRLTTSTGAGAGTGAVPDTRSPPLPPEDDGTAPPTAGGETTGPGNGPPASADDVGVGTDADLEAGTEAAVGTTPGTDAGGGGGRAAVEARTEAGADAGNEADPHSVDDDSAADGDDSNGTTGIAEGDADSDGTDGTDGGRSARDGGRTSRDGGQVGGMEVLPIGILVFVVVVLLVANMWGVVDSRVAVDAAAREAARTYVEAAVTDQGAAELAAAEAIDAGLAALDAHGRGEVWLESVSSPDGEGLFDRCAEVRFGASYEVPAVDLPWIGGFGDSFEITAHHTELVDRYRDGVPGDASGC